MNNKFFLLFILLGAFVVRLYGFSQPIADWHSWRQADTSSVSRYFSEYGFDLLHPRYHDLSNVPSGLNNPEGYRFVEFPLYNALQAGFFQIFGVLSIEEWGRLVSIGFSLAGIYFLYSIVMQHTDRRTALLSAFFYAFLPFSIFYSRTILPDTAMVSASLGGIFFFGRFLSSSDSTKKKTNSWLYFVLTFLFTSAALLMKPYAVFFALPMGILAYQQYGFTLWRQWKIWLLAVLCVVPLVLWRLWIQQFPEGIPVSAWLFNGNGIRFRPSFFRWMLYERTTKLIAGYTGIILLLLGTIYLVKQKSRLLLGSFVVSSILYVTIFATGNVQHDYYQIVIMPTIAILFGLGGSYLLQRTTKVLGISLGGIIFVVLTLSAFFFSFQQVKEYYRINDAIVIAGMAVDARVPKDALVIANNNGDTSFLYHTKRRGWASFQNDIPVMRDKLGADYLVLLHPSVQDRELGQQFKKIAEEKEYILFDLRLKP